MKHAFLITAYGHFDLLFNLVNTLQHPDVFFYIHIDKKTEKQAECSPYVKKLRLLTNVRILSNNIKVNWGAFSHTKAILLLLKEAVKNQDIDFFHTMSAQDFPIYDISTILEFFKTAKQNKSEYIFCKEVPTPTWGKNQGLDRFLYYHFNDLLNPKIKIQWIMLRLLVKIQQLLKIKRPFPKEFNQLYGGHIWWSLSRESILYILKYLDDNPAFLNRFKHTHCSEEIIFQTIIMNSPFKDKVMYNNLRYVEMQGSSPKILTENDYVKIMSSDKIFVRKIGAESKLLIEKITEQ